MDFKYKSQLFINQVASFKIVTLIFYLKVEVTTLINLIDKVGYVDRYK